MFAIADNVICLALVDDPVGGHFANRVLEALRPLPGCFALVPVAHRKAMTMASVIDSPVSSANSRGSRSASSFLMLSAICYQYRQTATSGRSRPMPSPDGRCRPFLISLRARFCREPLGMRLLARLGLPARFGLDHRRLESLDEAFSGDPRDSATASGSQRR